MSIEGLFFKFPADLKKLLTNFTLDEIQEELKSLEEVNCENNSPLKVATQTGHALIFSLMINMPLTPGEIISLTISDLSFNPQKNCWQLNISGKHSRIVIAPASFSKLITEYLTCRKILTGNDINCETLFLSKPKRRKSGLQATPYSNSNLVALLKNKTAYLFKGIPLNSVSFRAMYILKEMKKENSIKKLIEIGENLGLSDETLIDTYYQISSFGINEIPINLGRVDWNVDPILIHEDLANICTTHNPYWFLDQCIEKLENKISTTKDPISRLTHLRDQTILFFLKYLPLRLSEIQNLSDINLKLSDNMLMTINTEFRGMKRTVIAPVAVSNALVRWQTAKMNHQLSCNNLVFPAHLKHIDGTLKGGLLNSQTIATMIERHILLLSDYEKYANISCFRQMYFYIELSKSAQIPDLIRVANNLGISFSYALNMYKQIKLRFLVTD